MRQSTREYRTRQLLAACAFLFALVLSVVPASGVTSTAQARCELKGVSIAAPGGGFWAVVVNGQGLPVAIAVDEKGNYAVFPTRAKAEKVAGQIADYLCKYGRNGGGALGETPPFMPIDAGEFPY